MNSNYWSTILKKYGTNSETLATFKFFKIFSAEVTSILCKTKSHIPSEGKPYTVCIIISKSYNILSTIASFFMSSAGKIAGMREFKVKFFE